MPKTESLTAAETPQSPLSPPPPPATPRVTSIDALRGLVMFWMIFVNDLAGADAHVPAWLGHHGKGSGMYFADGVFSSFLFIVGMSIPFALGSRRAKGESTWGNILHIITRTLSLLFIGILMVNDGPNAEKMGWMVRGANGKLTGWSSTWWVALMYLSAMLAFCSISPWSGRAASERSKKIFQRISLGLRLAGLAALAWLTLAWRNKSGQGIVNFSPFSIRHSWYGILGLIGWAYLVAAMVHLAFRQRRWALLGCVIFLYLLFAAERKGWFDHFFLSRIVGVGETLGSQAAISVSGLLLASILFTPNTATFAARAKFTGLFIGVCLIAAILLKPAYGISKNNATPSWCLISSAIAATLWLGFHYICEVRRVPYVSRAFAVAGQNVLLAYLLSEGLESFFKLAHMSDWYGGLSGPTLANALCRSAGLGIVLLAFVAGVNRLGFKIKL